MNSKTKKVLAVVFASIDLVLMITGLFVVYSSFEGESVFKLILGIWLLYSPSKMGWTSLLKSKKDCKCKDK